MQAPPTAPTAQGSFAKTPFPHLLVYALERALTGTFELHFGATSLATILVVGGVPAKIRLSEPVHFLGDIMAELGIVPGDAVRAAHERIAQAPGRLMGQVLKELGACDEARVEAGVRAQLDRKMEHLFGLTADTVFSYYDNFDALAGYGGPPTPLDPFPALWRGVRQAPAWEHVDATLRRVGQSAVRVAPTANLDRFQFTRVEVGALELLRQRPMRIVDLANSKVIGPSAAQLLIYTLMITKQVDLVETPSMKPQPPRAPGSAPGLAPGAMAPPSGQAFARVQLQAKPAMRAPLIIEEGPVARSASDGRIASPLPQPIPLPDAAYNHNNPVIPMAPMAPLISGLPQADEGASGGGELGLDIASMINTTIQSSMPGPMMTHDGPYPSSGSAPPPAAPSSSPMVAGASVAPGSSPSMAPSSPSVVPEATGSSPNLTAEQSSLKQKILERAAQISGQDYFQMLGLERDATPEVVQKTFFGLAKVWHPDRLPTALMEVKDACSKVFTHLTEAQATLCDAERRDEYMTLLKDGGATPDDQAKIHAILEAATEFQKAEIMLKRNDTAQAYEHARKALALDPEQADYLAMVTWLDSQKAEWIGREKTLEKIAVLDRCIKMNANSERAYFWRGMLFKRIDEGSKAMKDFKKASELNPRNLDALREVRLHNIRGGQSKPPPGGGSGGGRPGGKPAQPETLGGLFGKLFKK